MSAYTDVTAWFPGNRTENFSLASVKQVVNTLLSRNYKPCEEPIKLNLPNDITLIYDADLLRLFVRGHECIESVIEQLQCDGVYRNSVKLYGHRNNEIEAGSLWMRRSLQMVLVNADEHATAVFSESQFEEVV